MAAWKMKSCEENSRSQRRLAVKTQRSLSSQNDHVKTGKEIIFRWVNVKDRERSKKPSKYHADVAALLLRSPKKWLWKGSSKLGVCENVSAKPFYNHLGFKEFRLTLLTQWVTTTCKRENAFVIFLEVFTRTPERDHIIFTDECVMYRCWTSRNYYLQSKGNPLLCEELQRNSPHVMIKTGISAGHWLGPYFFAGPENRYLFAHVARPVDGANRTHESYW